MALAPAEHLLQELGITDPDEIDLEAIAYHVGARVRYAPLHGCEARIVGHGNSAIITVNTSSSFSRRRFSIAHALGHWKYHRGKSLVCRVDEYLPHNTSSPERIADSYAADLLMPRYLFDPLVRKYPKLSFKVVSSLADSFKTSQTATAIRLVQSDYAPAVLVCHGHQGRKWFASAPMVPAKWFPRDSLDAASFASDILFGSGRNDPMPRRIGADAWFDRRDAECFEISEQTIRTTSDEILTILLVEDEAMLED